MFTAQNLLEAIVIVAHILILIGVLLVIFFALHPRESNNKIILVDKMNRKQDLSEEGTGFLGKRRYNSYNAGQVPGTWNKADVVTDEFIPKGTKVKVVKVEGMHCCRKAE